MINKIAKMEVVKSKLVSIAYEDLLSQKDLNAVIEEAYGLNGLGALFVTGIPGYAELRRKTLPLIHKMASLPADTLKKYERPDTFYTRGWSKVALRNEHSQTYRGSFYYAYPFSRRFEVSPENEAIFSPQERRLFTCENVWIEEHPEIERAAKELTKTMFEVGVLLAGKIDRYVLSQVGTYSPHCLEEIITGGRTHIGRLLYYYPFKATGNQVNDWATLHNDFGALTALAAGLYLDEHGEQTSLPVCSGGLHIRNRQGAVERVSIPCDSLAFQLGESMRILSGGCLQATPHSVGTSKELAGRGIGRATIALFMQPDPLQVMRVPEGVDPETVVEQATVVRPLRNRWQNGITFKEFHYNNFTKFK